MVRQYNNGLVKWNVRRVCVCVCVYSLGVLKEPKIMAGVWLFIFYFTCIILARQVEETCVWLPVSACV